MTQNERLSKLLKAYRLMNYYHIATYAKKLNITIFELHDIESGIIDITDNIIQKYIDIDEHAIDFILMKDSKYSITNKYKNWVVNTLYTFVIWATARPGISKKFR